MPSSFDDRSGPDGARRSVELLSRFAKGDDSALGELVDRESPRILRRLRARMPRDLNARLGASDLLQVTAADLVRLRGRFVDLGVPAFRELVATIADRALSQAIKRERADKRTPAMEARMRPVGPEESAGDPLEKLGAADTRTPSRVHDRAETVSKLQGCITELSEPDREVLQLIDYEELSCAEAAERLGVSVSAVQQRHHRALRRLGEMMRRSRPTSDR